MSDKCKLLVIVLFFSPVSVISLDSILDVTIGYAENFPQNESDILAGKFPEQVHFHVQSHSEAELPQDKEGVERWCQDCWRNKEEQLREFYTGPRVFRDKPIQTRVRDEQEVQHLFKFTCLFWTVFEICVVVFMIYAPVLRWYSLFSIITYVLISKYGGIDVLLDSEASDLCK
jgi:lysocardiolipin and lysophospholipid acyltransferase